MTDRSAGQDAESWPALGFPGEGLGQSVTRRSRVPPRPKPEAAGAARRKESPSSPLGVPPHQGAAGVVIASSHTAEDLGARAVTGPGGREGPPTAAPATRSSQTAVHGSPAPHLPRPLS